MSDVAIPMQMGVSSLPYSFRYYHFILSYIQENINPNRKKYLSLKSKVGIAFEYNRSIRAELGLIEDPDAQSKNKKLSFKTVERVKGENNMMNHFYSPHVQQVQYSNYVTLDGKIRGQLKLDPNKEENE